MDLINTTLISALFANLILALLSYFKSKKSKVNLVWSAVVGTVIFWILSMIFYRSASPENSVFWCRILYISAIFIPITFLYFSFLYPEGKWTISRRSRVLVALPTLAIISLVILPNVIIKDVVIRPGQEKEIIWGHFYFLYALYISSYFTLALWNLFKKYLRSSGRLKTQLTYMLLGTSVSIVSGCTFNLIMPWVGNFRFNWLGQVTTLLMVACISYAIAKHQLLGVRIVLTELLVMIIAIILLTQAIITEPPWIKILNFGVFLLFLVFGYLLIKGVLKEIEYRESLQKAYGELKKVDEAKSEFIAMASHQLRTPLSAIKGYASLLLEGIYGRMPQKAKKPLENIFASNQRLVGIVESLLNVSKIEMGKMEAEKEKVSIEEIINEVTEEMKLKAKEKNLKFIWERPKIPLPKILIDNLKIRQVILNLVDNAIRYTQEGKIEIKCQMSNDKCQILVKDTGEGLTQEEKEKIFEAFSRGGAGTTYWIQGAGLGLYLAKKYVELHEGKIWAESKGKGKGSTFYVELPIK